MQAGRVRTENRWFWFDSGPDPGDQYMSNLLLVLSEAGFWLVGGNPHTEPTSIRKIKRLERSFWCSQASTLKQNCAGGTDGGGGGEGTSITHESERWINVWPKAAWRNGSASDSRFRRLGVRISLLSCSQSVHRHSQDHLRCLSTEKIGTTQRELALFEQRLLAS